VVTPGDVRASLREAGAALPGLGSGVAEAAVARGRVKLRRRRALRRAGGVAAVLAGVVAVSGVVLPTAPAEAAVSCYADRAVARGQARVGREGVRLTVHNATSDVVLLVAGDAVAIVPPGLSAVDVALRPGRVTVSCDTGRAGAVPASLTVRDPAGLYVEDRVDCAAREVRDLRGDGRVEQGDPVALTYARLRGVPSDAAVEPAGYPAASGRRAVRVRDGSRVVAVALWHAMPEPGSWVLDEVHLCAPLGLAAA